MRNQVFMFDTGEIVITPFPTLRRSDLENDIVLNILDSAYYVSANPLPPFRVVAVNEDNQIELASVFNLAHAEKVVGFTLIAVPEPMESVLVGVDGAITNTAWNWEIGQPLYLVDQGLIDVNPPVGGLYIIQVATAIAPNKLLIDFEPPIYL